MWEILLKQNCLFITIEVFISLLLCAVVYVTISLKRNHQKYSHIPGPPLDSFLTGNIPSLIKTTKEGGFFSSYLLDLTKRYGKTFKINFLHTPIIVTSDPEAVKEVLVTGHNPKDPSTYEDFGFLFGKRFVGNGLGTCTDYKEWIVKRMFMNPCFQKSYLRGLVDEFNHCGDHLMNHLTKLADGKTKIKMLEKFNHVSLNLICKVAFGMDIEIVDNGNSPFTKAIFLCLKGFAEKAKNPFVICNPANWGMVWETRKAVQYLRETGTRIIKERREKVAKGDYVPNDILTYLIKMEDENPEIDHEEILDDFVTIFIAGQETTANLLAFMVLCLGQNPDVMDRLQKEITSTVGDKSVLTFEDLNHFPYLDMVIKETLRLNPPIPQTFRKLEKECILDGHRVPANSVVAASTYVSSRMEDAFENPLKFDPERFSNESQRASVYIYYPFSIGPRSCIGRNFAEAEVKIIMIKMLQRFNIQLDPDQDFSSVTYTTLRPKDKAVCTLTLRDD